MKSFIQLFYRGYSLKFALMGRIPGAVKMAGVWLIPKTAEKPIDGRTRQGKELRHE